MRKTIKKEKILEVLDKLENAYPDASCELDYDSVFHLLIAVVLSAQTTDKSVNKITPKLFEKYKNARELSNASNEDIEALIKSIGLYKTKARNIISLSSILEEKYNGRVPQDFNELVALPGVGRKTANVMLSEAFGEQRIAVDTHVFRVANRIGLVCEKDVLATERELMNVIPNDKWSRSHHLLIIHGRRCCTARNPNCNNCPVYGLCLETYNNHLLQ